MGSKFKKYFKEQKKYYREIHWIGSLEYPFIRHYIRIIKENDGYITNEGNSLVGFHLDNRYQELNIKSPNILYTEDLINVHDTEQLKKKLEELPIDRGSQGDKNMSTKKRNYRTIREGQEFPGNDLHSRLCQFVFDTVDYFDLIDQFGDYGDYPTARQSVLAYIWDMSDKELIEDIKFGIEDEVEEHPYYDANDDKVARALVNEYEKKYSIREPQIKEGQEFPGNDLHSRMCDWLYSTNDYYDLQDACEFGESPKEKTWEMLDVELAHAIANELQSESHIWYLYTDDDPDNSPARKDGEALLAEYENLMKQYKEDYKRVKEAYISGTKYFIYGFDGEKRFGPHNFKIEVFYDDKDEAISIASNIAKNIDKYPVPTDTSMVVREESYDKNGVCTSSKQIWSSLVGLLNEKVETYFKDLDFKPIAISCMGNKKVWQENDETHGLVVFKITFKYIPTGEVWSELWEAHCLGHLEASYGVSEPDASDTVWTELIDAHFDDYLEVISDEVNDYYMSHDNAIVDGVIDMIESCIEKGCSELQFERI